MTRRFISKAFVGVILARALSFPAWADTTNGLVVSVHDGDTLTVLVGNQQVKVRLRFELCAA